MNNMKLFKLKGHERPITNIKFDISGNNILSSSKDANLVVWNINNNITKIKDIHCSGAIWHTGINKNIIYTGSADGIMTLWDYSGNKKKIYNENGPIRSISYNEDKEIYFVLSKKLTKTESKLSILNKDLHKLHEIEIDIEHNKAILLNDRIICGGIDGSLRHYLYKDNKIILLKSIQIHKSEITDIKIDYKKNILVTSSYDNNVKIFNLTTFEHIITYSHCVRVLSIAIHPFLNIIALGGGQDKMDVANSGDNDGFYVVFIDSINGKKLFQFDSKHFGPINTLCFNLENNRFVTGGEDGYIHVWICENNWIKNGIIEFNILKLNEMKKILNESKQLYDNLLGAGKKSKNQRRNLRKKINKLENNLSIKQEEMNEL
jgi:translation initiation factor 3 subunit I